MSKQRKPKREPEGASWMDTYGDLVTLLLTFFVMLFASSQMNESKWIRIVESFTGEPAASVVEPIDPLNPTSGFAPTDFIPKVTPRDKTEDKTAESDSEEEMPYDYKVQASFSDLYEKLTQYVQDNNLGGVIALEKDGEYIYITVLEGILFDDGQANVRDTQAEDILIDLGDMFSEYLDSIYLIDVTGYTDNTPIQTARYTDNMALSQARADTVGRFMSDHTGITINDFKLSGRGEADPVAPNDTKENKQKNRRVEFEVQSANILPR